MNSIDEIKARIDIVDLVSETVQLRRSGKNYTGFCPFHSNTRTPAFVVFPESGTWRCFGQCNEGGDIFSFVMKKEGWDFAEALRFLADKAGIQLKPPTPAEQAAAEEHEALRALLEEAVTFYRHQLLNTPAGQQALDYLHQRGLKDEIIEAFGLGYAPHGWEVTLNYFKAKGYAEKDLLEAGLIARHPSDDPHQPGRLYDRFRHRLMFPIRDERGRMAGFGARILDPNDQPKFINTPQTPIFDKGHLLYGLERARKAIRSQDQAVIVEGYLDVIALHQAGFMNTVSPMGTALTQQQLYLLKRHARRIVLALDADAAGNQATLRGLQLARQSLDRQPEPLFDVRGLLRYEARLQADVRVSTLPEGLDPDDIVRRDPQEWQRLVENARPLVVHVMEALVSGRDLDDPKVKSEIAAQVLPLIGDVPDPVERDTYRQRLARLLRVDERTLEVPLVGGQRRPSSRSAAARQVRRPEEAPVQAPSLPAPARVRHSLEAQILGSLLRRPDLLYQVDRRLQEEGLSRLGLDDFQHADHRALLKVLQESLDQDAAEPLNYVLSHLSLPMMEVADGLLARTENLEANDEHVLADILRMVLLLRRRTLLQYNEQLRFLQEDAQQQGDLLAMEYGKIVGSNNRLLRLVDRAIGKYTDRAWSSR
jgi:DNA primase